MGDAYRFLRPRSAFRSPLAARERTRIDRARAVDVARRPCVDAAVREVVVGTLRAWRAWSRSRTRRAASARRRRSTRLGAALAAPAPRVLLVDLDPQACLTYSVGLDPESLPPSLHDVLVGRSKAADASSSPAGRCAVLPGRDRPRRLRGAPRRRKVGREHAVARALEPVKDDYDIVLLDCPPSLGILTINGLTAADVVLIPLQCETLSHRGVGQLLETVADVRAYTKPDLARARRGRDDVRRPHAATRARCSADVEARYGLPVLEPLIPRSIRFAEAPATGRRSSTTRRRSSGAVAYRELAARARAAAMLAAVTRTPEPTGSAALFSTRGAQAGHARRRVRALPRPHPASATPDFAQRHLPFWVWTPVAAPLALRRAARRAGNARLGRRPAGSSSVEPRLRGARRRGARDRARRRSRRRPTRRGPRRAPRRPRGTRRRAGRPRACRARG